MALQEKLLTENKERGLRKHLQKVKSSLEWTYIDKKV